VGLEELRGNFLVNWDKMTTVILRERHGGKNPNIKEPYNPENQPAYGTRGRGHLNLGNRQLIATIYEQNGR